MSDQLTAEEINALLDGVSVAAEPEAPDPQLLADLLGEPTKAEPDPAPVLSPSAVPSVPGRADAVAARHAVEQADGLAWEAALQRVPGYENLCRRYPPITERQHPKHGRVIVLAYLEDQARRVRRNSMIGKYLFFDYPELEIIEPDTRAMGCRVSIKIIKYEVGLRIRFWENGPNGDIPGRAGAITVTEVGLRLERHGKAR